MDKKIIWTFDDLEFEKIFIGPVNHSLDIINSELNVHLNHINNHLLIEESDLDHLEVVVSVIKLLNRLYSEHIEWHTRDLIHYVMELKESKNLNETIEDLVRFSSHKVIVLNTFEGKKIYAKTLGQKKYLDSLNKNNIVFSSGPAGTGKTYLAVAYAVSELKKNHINKIIITRPVVEAGEKLGFLPGDLKEKVDPYLIPIYDALNEFLSKEVVERMMEKGVIEIAPLAYMRGRTLDQAIIILDEAQNTTTNQMKMFITRLGFNSKMIITGDASQIDLSSGVRSGFIEALNILKDIDGIQMIHFSKNDVMRHPLVAKIIERYDQI